MKRGGAHRYAARRACLGVDLSQQRHQEAYHPKSMCRQALLRSRASFKAA
jgi:hypothetical protein